MIFDNSLRVRITRAFLAFALAIASFFTLASYLSVEYIEQQAIDEQLKKLSSSLIEQHHEKVGMDMPSYIGFYANDSIPEVLRSEAPGIYETSLDGRDVHAYMVHDHANRYLVTYEVDEFENTKLVIIGALTVGFLSSLALALILGYATSRRIVAPVSALARAAHTNRDPAAYPFLDAKDEIGLLSRAFARRTRELQQVLERERLFTGDVSHELRTPLTIMLGAAEMLTLQLGDQPQQMAAAERIRRVASETSERIGALLMLSRSPKSLEATLTCLNHIVQTEFDRCQHLLAGKDVATHFHAENEIWLPVRPELAGIAISNLLRNACQHTEHGHVGVTLSSTSIVIEDTGTGIPPAVREKMFERFVHGREWQNEGIGLGLSIVKRVADHVGWRIHVESPEAGGSRFTLSFPEKPAGD